MRIFEQNLNLKVILSLLDENLFGVLLPLKISKNLRPSKPLKTSCEFVIFQIRIDFLNKNSNFN